MPFKKNHKLSNGRPEGSKNKATQKVRENFQNLVEVNMEQMQKDIDALEPYERIKVILQMSKFVLPNLRAIENQIEFIEQPLFSEVKTYVIDCPEHCDKSKQAKAGD